MGEVNPKWRRPPLPPEPPEELCFLQLDIDHYLGEGLPHSGGHCPIDGGLSNVGRGLSPIAGVSAP